MKALLLFIFVAIIASGCVSTNSTREDNNMTTGKTVQFDGEGVKLTGTLWSNPDSTKPALILVHQLGRDRHSFDSFAEAAFARGYSVLSFDVRGHGESRPNNLSYLNFNEADWQKIAGDIQSARNYLNKEKVLVVGSSIGANSALNFAAANPISCAGMVLLSPGINYRGIDGSESSATNQCPMLIVASKEDQYSNESSQTIFSNSQITDKRLLTVENAGHGTDMFAKAKSLQSEVLDWLEKHSK